MANFFSRVLPSTGPYTLFTGVTGPDGKTWEPKHWNGLQSHEALEKKVQELSMQPLNVYYAVGSYAGLNRADPIAKRALWLDLDFKDLGSIEDAISGLNTFIRSTGLPPPSIHVSSGRGLHVYWCLDRDVPVDEWKPVALALKAKCKELGFKADPQTFDAARIMRCPGTLNRKGKDPLPCVIREDNGATYSLEALAAQLGAATPSVASQGARAKLASLAPADVLKTKQNFKPLGANEVAGMLASVKLQEGDRETWTLVLRAVQDWGQKSEESWEIFDAWSNTQPDYEVVENRKVWNGFHPGGGITIATLVKMAVDAGYVPPDVPAPVQTVLPGSLAEQIAAPSAEPDDAIVPVVCVVSDALMVATQHAVNSTGRSRFNAQEAVNYLSSEFVIVTEQPEFYYSMTKRALLKDKTIDKMLTRWMPLNGAKKPISATIIMQQNGVKQSVKQPGYHPTAAAIYAEGGVNYANRYTAPDDMLQANAYEIKMIEMFWAHMFPRPEDQQFSKYLMQSYGHLVQHPEIKIGSAPLVIGEPGSGKTTLTYDIVRRLVGLQNAQLVDNKTLKGMYNSYAGDKHVLYFDEIKVQGRLDSEDIANSMKNMVVGATLSIHAKFLSPFEIPNRVYVTATSNYDDAISLSSNKERRWAVYEHFPTRDRKTMKRFFTMMHAWMEGPRGPGVLRWYFSQVDITGYGPHDDPPWTLAKDNMIAKSQVREVQSLSEAMKNGAWPFDRSLTTIVRVQQFLHAETARTYSSVEAGKFLRVAARDAVEIKPMNIGGDTKRVFCWKDPHHWTSVATDAERKKELG
jgi:hypothetical protein